MLRAHIDRDGLLVGADPSVLALNARAGGALGAPMAIGPIAALARLAARLGVLVSRSVTVADEQADLDLWVRMQPDADGVALAIADWREIRPWRPAAPMTTDSPLPLVAGASGWETDAAMRLVALPADAAVRFGVEPAAALGRPFTHLVRLAEDADGGLPLLVAMAGGGGFAEQRAHVRASGRAVLLTGRARYDAAGAFAGFAGTIMLDRAGGEATGDAIAGRLESVLRAPLGRIVATADAIHAQREGALDAGYVDYAADIASAGRHLLGLVDDLADLHAIERDDFAIAAEPIDLADVARRAAGLLGVRAADAGVGIERPAADVVLPAIGEFRRALQVMVNIVGNAVRYSPRGGTMAIGARHDGDRAIVVVADQGRGLATQDQARIFDKFERVDRDEPGGSGIGLYVARRLARAMRGDLTVDSAPGQGARFTFSLPIASAP